MKRWDHKDREARRAITDAQNDITHLMDWMETWNAAGERMKNACEMHRAETDIRHVLAQVLEFGQLERNDKQSGDNPRERLF